MSSDRLAAFVGLGDVDRAADWQSTNMHLIALQAQIDALTKAKADSDANLAHYVSLYEEAPFGYCTVDEGGRVLHANLWLHAQLGLPSSQVIGDGQLGRFVAPEDYALWCDWCEKLFAGVGSQTIELRLRGQRAESAENGGFSWIWVHMAGRMVRSEVGARVIHVAITDITKIKMCVIELEQLAHSDPLTNLPNRLLLTDRLKHATVQAQRRCQHMAVVFIDLDGFKAVNDRHGHQVGDQLLMGIAASMKEALRESDTLARIGGDEFAALLIDIDDIAIFEPLLGRLLGAAATPVAIGDLLLQFTASMGVTLYPQAEGIDCDQLMRQADQAMYEAKLAGGNRYCFFKST